MSGRTRLFARGVLAAVALGLAAKLAPVATSSSAPASETLGLGQRDVRVYDDFGDVVTTVGAGEHPSFPGASAVELAIWKAAVEWGSRLHGDGQGDPHQPGGLGSGGANFDFSWQGRAPGVGNRDANVCSQVPGDGAGILAYCETPVGDGWRVRFYGAVPWSAGPGTEGAGIDLQGVATHELGHALGLGHSADTSATMYSSVFGTGAYLRSIQADDQAALQALYGARAATKPRITGVELADGLVTIHGSGFSPADNVAWFTRAAPNVEGTPVRVSGLASSGGGTRIVVALPADAGPGDVLVKHDGSGHSALSNAWPLDTRLPTVPHWAPVVIDVAPERVASVASEPQWVVLTGSNLASVTFVVVDGAPLDASDVVLESDATLRFAMPLVSRLGLVSVDLVAPGDVVTSLGVEVDSADPPALWLAPESLVEGAPLSLAVGAAPGSHVWIAVSPHLVPSVAPGVVDAAIGAGFATLYLLATPLASDAGHATFELPVAGLAPGTELYFQAAVLAPGTPLPLASTNVAEATFVP